MNAGLTSAGLGVVIAVGILWLVQRDRMHGGYALWWLLVAAGALAVGFFPSLVDWLGVRLGVHYPPMLLVLGALAVIVLKLAATDIDATVRERRVRRLLQKVAILELELKTMRAELDQRAAADAAAALSAVDSRGTAPLSHAGDTASPTPPIRRAAL